MEEYLIYIKPLCKNNDGTYEYEFLFSETPEDVWGIGWDEYNPSGIDKNMIAPDETTYSKKYKVETKFRLTTIEETTCYSMEYATYGITALGWINLDGLEEYPENGRMVFHFGDTKEKVSELLDDYGYVLN